MIVLLGVLLMILGFVLRIDAISVIIVSAVVTGLLGGSSFLDVLDLLGKSFIEARYIILLLLVLPVIGTLERNGLREKAGQIIEKVRGATSGRILIFYLFFRMATVAFFIQVGGFVQMVRPLIYPMLVGTIKNRYKLEKIPDKVDEMIKAYAASADNFGNFFAQNFFVGAGGVLLIVGVLNANHFNIDIYSVAKATFLPASVAFVSVSVSFLILDWRVAKSLKNLKEEDAK